MDFLAQIPLVQFFPVVWLIVLLAVIFLNLSLPENDFLYKLKQMLRITD